MISKTFSNYIRTPVMLLVLIEAAILYSAVYFAALVWFNGNLTLFEQVQGPLAPRAIGVAVIMLLSLLSMGLYQFHQRIYFQEVIVRVFVGFLIGCAALAITYFLMPSVTLSRGVGIVAILYALTLLLAVRFYFVRTVDNNIFKRRTMVYGAGERAESISKLRRKADRRGFSLVGVVPAQGDKFVGKSEKILNAGRSLIDLARENNADEIIIAMDDRRGNLPVRELLECKVRGIEVLELVEFLERETGKIRIDLVSRGWLIFSPGFRNTRLTRFFKRVTDIVVSAVAMALTSPVFLLTALAIVFEDGLRKPILYRQIRTGLHGSPISVLKFRSMCVDAEADGKAVWAGENDSRVTRVGRFIRKVRIDELPQLINVLCGSMSMVGPRPERPEFVKQLSESVPYYAERHCLKPGLTGWAQLRYNYGSSKEDAIEKLQYDLYYLKNNNLLLDLVIMLQTAEVILWGKGAR